MRFDMQARKLSMVFNLVCAVYAFNFLAERTVHLTFIETFSYWSALLVISGDKPFTKREGYDCRTHADPVRIGNFIQTIYVTVTNHHVAGFLLNI